MKNLGVTALHALVVLLAVGVGGCGVGSVAPLVSDADVRFDPALVGGWRDSSDEESVVVTASGPDRYSVVYTDSDGKVGRFQGALGRVGSLRILDLEPEELPVQASDVYKSLLLPLHGAVFVESVDPQLRFRILDADSLKAYLQREPRAVAHVLRDEAVILTAETADLQRFLVAYVGRKGALGGPNVMVRRSP